MATVGTPTGGRNEILTAAYPNHADYTLVAYTNTANSLSSSSVAADLTQPATAAGYAAITLDGTWSVDNGVATYVHSTPTYPRWTASGSWGGVTVTGIAIVYDTVLMHFKDLAAGWVPVANRILEVDVNTIL